MKFRIEKKLFGDVLKQVGTSSSKPAISRVKVSVDNTGVVFSGLNEGGTILAGVWVKEKEGLCEVFEKGSAYIDITELVKEVPKLKSEMVTVTIDNNTIVQGVDEVLIKENVLENSPMPAEFIPDGKTLVFTTQGNKDINFSVHTVVTEFDELPLDTPLVILKADKNDGKISVVAQDQITKYERKFKGDKIETDVELWLDSDFFGSVAKMLKKAEIVYLSFNELAMIAKGTFEWGEAAYMVVGKEKEV